MAAENVTNNSPKTCPRCGSEMLRNDFGWICINNMQCGQPIIRGGSGEQISLTSGGLPSRKDCRKFNMVKNVDWTRVEKQEKGDVK